MRSDWPGDENLIVSTQYIVVTPHKFETMFQKTAHTFDSVTEIKHGDGSSVLHAFRPFVLGLNVKNYLFICDKTLRFGSGGAFHPLASRL